MGKLLDLFKNVGIAIPTALAKWGQEVSRAVDSSSGEYVIAANTSGGQAIADLSASTVLILDTKASDHGVPYNPTTGAFTLEKNTLYELSFYPRFDTFNTVASDYAYTFWANDAGNALVPFTGSFSMPPASTLNQSQQSVAKLVYGTGNAAELIYLRSAGGTGSANLSLRSYAVVRKLRSA